ncbi:MAG: hypothetical protein OSB09_10210 [Planctomycetota bacterium]|nr:hypothetical protein [Planctomycetota bacterium]
MKQDPRNTPLPPPDGVPGKRSDAPSREVQWLDVVSHPALPLPIKIEPEVPSSRRTLPPLTTIPEADPLPAATTFEPRPVVSEGLLRILAILVLTAIFLISWQGTAGENSESNPGASKWIRSQ